MGVSLVTSFVPSASNVGAAISMLFGAFLSYGFYNLYLHPLARFPGPFLYRAYVFPFVYMHSTGQLAQKNVEFHRKYGPVVRIGPNELSFISAQAWNDIYGLLPGRKQMPKDRWSYMPDMGGLLVADDVKHAQRRKLLMSSFSNKAIEEQQPMLMSFVDLLITRLKGQVDDGKDVQDISAWYNWTTFDFTGEFAFGQSFNCLEKMTWHPWMKTIFQGITLGCAISQLERYGVYTLLKTLLPEAALKTKRELDNYVIEHVNQRMKEGNKADKPDLFRNLMRENEHIDLDPLYHDCTNLVIAGSETTATLLTATTYFLLSTPDKYTTAQKEVRTVFKSDDDINMHSVKDLTYCLAVLNEVLRMFPPVPVGMARKVPPGNGALIDGQYVPSGTSVSVYQLAGSMSPLNWTHPDEFLPERWLPEKKETFSGDIQAASKPFSHGPRECIGKAAAYVEMRIILARILWNFDMELAEGMQDWFSRCRAFTVWEKPPLMIKLRKSGI